MFNNFNQRLSDLENYIDNGGNFNALLQNKIQKSPQLQQKYNVIQNMIKSNNMTQEQFILQNARQNGFDLEQFTRIAKKLNLIK